MGIPTKFRLGERMLLVVTDDLRCGLDIRETQIDRRQDLLIGAFILLILCCDLCTVSSTLPLKALFFCDECVVKVLDILLGTLSRAFDIH